MKTSSFFVTTVALVAATSTVVARNSQPPPQLPTCNKQQLHALRSDPTHNQYLKLGSACAADSKNMEDLNAFCQSANCLETARTSEKVNFPECLVQGKEAFKRGSEALYRELCAKVEKACSPQEVQNFYSLPSVNTYKTLFQKCAENSDTVEAVCNNPACRQAGAAGTALPIPNDCTIDGDHLSEIILTTEKMKQMCSA